jgi:hypothetical protein
MGRGMLIAVSGAVVAGSVGGGLAALHAPEPPAPAMSPAMSPAAPPPAPRALLVLQMQAVLARFAAWSRDHAGAPCPDGAALGRVTLDPWGHPLRLTCTDQPADQMAGAISAGPDGVAGNGDDVASWDLGREVTELVHGARWAQAPEVPAAPPAQPPIIQRGKDRSHARAHRPAAPTPPSTAAPLDPGADDIPARR